MPKTSRKADDAFRPIENADTALHAPIRERSVQGWAMHVVRFLCPRCPSVELTPDLVYDTLTLVAETKEFPRGAFVTIRDLGAFTQTELWMVYDWAVRERLAASGVLTQRSRRLKPYLVTLLQRTVRELPL